MEYRIEVKGKSYVLPTRTPEMDDRIGKIQDIEKRLRTGGITRREVRKEQYDFVTDCIEGFLPPFEEMDVGELEVVVVKIVNAYQRPAAQEKIEASMAALREVTDRAEFKKFTSVLSKSKR